MEALDKAVSAIGGVAALAAAIGVSSNAPSMWRKRKNIPAEYCPAIERATRERGRPVLCEELRPDVPWEVLRPQSSPSSEGSASPIEMTSGCDAVTGGA